MGENFSLQSNLHQYFHLSAISWQGSSLQRACCHEATRVSLFVNSGSESVLSFGRHDYIKTIIVHCVLHQGQSARRILHRALSVEAKMIEKTHMTWWRCRYGRRSLGLTLSTKLSSACSRRSNTACLTKDSKFRSRFRGTSNAGKRSPISPINTGTSSVTILGMLKSRRERIRTWSSGRSGSSRLREPATTSTDLIARKPQS